MLSKKVILTTLLGLGCTCASAAPADLYNNDFESGASSSSALVVTATQFPEVADASAVFGFDYSTLGLPAAPTPGVSTTRGLHLRANTTDNTTGAESVGIAVYPGGTGGVASGDFVASVYAYAYTSGAANQTTTTSFFTAGLFGNGTKGNYQLATDTDGYFWHLSNDGGPTFDLLSLVGNPGATPSLLAPTNVSGNPTATDSNNPAYPLNNVAGWGNGTNRSTQQFALNSGENQWIQLAVGQVNGKAFFAARATGVTNVAPTGGETPIEPSGGGGGGEWVVLDSFDNTFAGALSSGRPFFGWADLNDTANADIGVVFDRMRVSTLADGDSDFDGDVDFADAMRLRFHYSGSGVFADGGTGTAATAHTYNWVLGDTDSDRDVDLPDAVAFRNAFTGQLDAATASSEPVTLVYDATTGALSLEGDASLVAMSITSSAGALQIADRASDAATAQMFTLASTAHEFAAMTLSGAWSASEMPLPALAGDGALGFEFALEGDSATRVGLVRVVPEPATGAIAAGCGVIFCRRRR